MSAYYKKALKDFVNVSPTDVVGELSRKLLQRFSGNQQQQLIAWQVQVELMQTAARYLLNRFPRAADWGILFEFPLMRLQRRLDVVLLAGEIVTVIEFKVGAATYERGAASQVEDYALDLRDFHSASRHSTIVPVLCATDARDEPFHHVIRGSVGLVHFTNRSTLPSLLEALAKAQEESNTPQLGYEDWDAAPYRPVPTIVEAAQFLYAGHKVSEIAHAAADAENLTMTSDRLVEIVADARAKRRHAVCFVTGIPGSGKTLTGLNLVHTEHVQADEEWKAAYLSGNTPLVEVLREALARDRCRRTGERILNARRVVRTEIQHLMDYLREYITENPSHNPHENVIVFDEAQRAWDAAYGKQKFNRAASEPTLFLEIMARREDWAVIVALVGGGQEINTGEGGLRLWGEALLEKPQWDIFAAPDVISSNDLSSNQTLFATAASYPGCIEVDPKLHLGVAVRSIRCERVALWVDRVLAGRFSVARNLADRITDFPVYLTRDLVEVRSLLQDLTRGSRRSGLVASSGARRLRADGLGVTLSATDKDAYIHWYLEPTGDIRSSNALEVTANEYTCQGLELDYVGVCWGGDMLWSSRATSWDFNKLSGNKWNAVRKHSTQEFIRNKYRVLMTRARFAMVLWVPKGDTSDPTRDTDSLDSTAAALQMAGARPAEELLRGLASDLAATG